MRRIIFSLLFSYIALESYSQSAIARIYIQGGKNAWENYMKEVYEFTDFQNGLVQFKNGQKYKSKLNYNRVLGTIQFIDEKGDTLALSNEESIALVNIGTTAFHYSPQCIQELNGNDRIKLAMNQRIRIADKQKVGALGIPNSTSSIDSYDRRDSKSINRFDVNEELLLRKTTTYYIGNNDDVFLPATRKNILALFPKFEAPVKQYLKDNATDFSRQEDLEKLAAYLGQL